MSSTRRNGRARVHLAARRVVLASLAAGGDPVARWIRGRTDDVYGVYEDIRRRGPVVPSRTGVHALTSRALCDRVLRDPGFGVRTAAGAPATPDPLTVDVPSTLSGSFLELDPPDHTRLRRITAPAFRPAAVRAWTPSVRALADDLADRVEHRLRRGEATDLMAEFAAPFPITVISTLLGIPDADAERFRVIGALVGQALDGVSSVRQAEQLRQAGGELERMFTRLLDERARDPRDDVLSVLAAARAEGAATARDALEVAGLLLIAGFETTVNLIGNGVAALHRHPRHWHELRDDPALAPAIVEEVLRWDPSVQGTMRIAHAGTELAGVPIRAGNTVLVLTAAANRDPSVYRDPGVFDPHRTGEPDHLSFSAGIHYCLGAALARVEGAVALQALSSRLPGLAVLPGALRRSGATIRGFARLPVTA